MTIALFSQRVNNSMFASDEEDDEHYKLKPEEDEDEEEEDEEELTSGVIYGNAAEGDSRFSRQSSTSSASGPGGGGSKNDVAAMLESERDPQRLALLKIIFAVLARLSKPSEEVLADGPNESCLRVNTSYVSVVRAVSLVMNELYKEGHEEEEEAAADQERGEKIDFTPEVHFPPGWIWIAKQGKADIKQFMKLTGKMQQASVLQAIRGIRFLDKEKVVARVHAVSNTCRDVLQALTTGTYDLSSDTQRVVERTTRNFKEYLEHHEDLRSLSAEASKSVELITQFIADGKHAIDVTLASEKASAGASRKRQKKDEEGGVGANPAHPKPPPRKRAKKATPPDPQTALQEPTSTPFS